MLCAWKEGACSGEVDREAGSHGGAVALAGPVGGAQPLGVQPLDGLRDLRRAPRAHPPPWRPHLLSSAAELEKGPPPVCVANIRRCAGRGAQARFQRRMRTGGLEEAADSPDGRGESLVRLRESTAVLWRASCPTSRRCCT